MSVLRTGVKLFLMYIAYHLSVCDYLQPKTSIQISGKVDETCASVEELYLVNEKINPILNLLKNSKFFRIFKVNLENECPFWDVQGSWITNKCSVGECENDEVPDEWKQCNQTFDVERRLQSNEISLIGSFAIQKSINEWMKSEEQDQNAIFVNLNKNLESMTYFNGSHIWDAIYLENWLSFRTRHQCKEDLILYKLISGVHTNINMHITHFNFDLDGQILPPDHQRYYETVGWHEERISNLFYTYSFVLKAVNHLSDKVNGFSYLSDNPKVNKNVKDNLNALIENSIKTCDNPFREHQTLDISKIKPVFYNITRILDWVTCEKCRLHGKLQFTGLTAVMKIMFGKGEEAKLTRNEMVGLINLLAKLSNSIKWYKEWQEFEKTKERMGDYRF